MQAQAGDSGETEGERDAEDTQPQRKREGGEGGEPAGDWRCWRQLVPGGPVS